MAKSDPRLKTLGQNIERLRRAAGWSMEELGRRMKSSENSVRNWERGTSAITFDNFLALADALNVSPVDLVRASISRFDVAPLIARFKSSHWAELLEAEHGKPFGPGDEFWLLSSAIAETLGSKEPDDRQIYLLVLFNRRRQGDTKRRK